MQLRITARSNHFVHFRYSVPDLCRCCRHHLHFAVQSAKSPARVDRIPFQAAALQRRDPAAIARCAHFQTAGLRAMQPMQHARWCRQARRRGANTTVTITGSMWYLASAATICGGQLGQAFQMRQPAAATCLISSSTPSAVSAAASRRTTPMFIASRGFCFRVNVKASYIYI